MVRLKLQLHGIAWACVIAMTAGAHAADPAEVLPAPTFEERFVPLVSGWYVRGDIGYRKTDIGSVSTPLSQPSGMSSLDSTLNGMNIPTFGPAVIGVILGSPGDPNPAGTPWSIKDGPTFGLGAGYKYKWFRTDVTADFATASRIEGGSGIANGFYSNKIDALTILANVYLDLGEWSGFTPYVGAGIGGSKLSVREFTYSPVMFPVAMPPQETSKWNFSWAVTGGVAFRFAPNLLLDIGYRYVKLGDAVHGFKPPLGMVRLDFKDLTAQEVRIGLRYELD